MISVKSLRYFGEIEFAMSIRTDGKQSKSDYLEAKKELQDYIASLEAENEQLRERTRWIPVGERLPDVDKWVNIYLPDHKSVTDAFRQETDSGWKWETNDFVIGEPCHVTHWMPLPEAPKEDE